MPDDDIAARLRDLAEAMDHHGLTVGGMIGSHIREAADIIERQARQLAFDPVHARLIAAAVAIEDSGKLPEGWRVGLDDGEVCFFDANGREELGLRWFDALGHWHCDDGACAGWSSHDPVEAAVAAIAATTEGTTPP